MKKLENEESSWIVCKDCHGLGKKKRRISKKARLIYQKALERYKLTKEEGAPPSPPKRAIYSCSSCNGSGLIHSNSHPKADNDNYPHIAIIGAGIGGVALAVACLHRKIPFTIYERDYDFHSRSQGYGLTLQQASRAIKGLGLPSLEEGVMSTRHIVHSVEGKVIGEWGMRKWLQTGTKTNPKRNNIHISRQSLRLALLKQLGGPDTVQWRHRLIDFKVCESGEISLSFQVDGKAKNVKADLLVGADGIRSSVRRILIGDEVTPLRYLGCIVILGICHLKDLEGAESTLLDSATVFQTVNGNERIYIMPYSSDAIMWQLSFPIPENEAIALSAKGVKALKEEACRRCNWHNPIPQILAGTQEALISGYPVYDRELLKAETLENSGSVTLIGDAAHPMSPFKGQGANQALLDALELARRISRECRSLTHWKMAGLRKTVLKEFEAEMLARSASKVKDSAEAAKFLHSDIALYEADEPRGRCLKRNSL
jgi:2-polyprenyl-6-methoxyphenol hydroxylase-like FAD-dependent oxidoreductase